MNKKLFLKLGVGTLVAMAPLSFIACGQKNSPVGIINPSNLNVSNSDNTSQNTVEESEKDIASPVNIEQKAKQKSDNTEHKVEQKLDNTEQRVEEKSDNTEQKVEQKSENIEQKSEQKSEKYYYTLIEEAKQKQIDYINSIEDPKEKQSVQTAFSAAVYKANELELKYPEDSEIISASLKKVLDGTK